MSDQKRCIVVGATSGIGRALALAFATRGYTVGITGRRADLLATLDAALSGTSFQSAFDIRDDGAQAALADLIAQMKTVDVVVVCAGIGARNPTLDWHIEHDTVSTNVMGFASMCNVAWQHFVERESGHLVGISSIAAVRGGPIPAYNASKAFVSSYLEGLRARAMKDRRAITVTDIKPGFVHTDMAKGNLFWVASTEKAANQIVEAVEAKRKHAYVTRRWRLIAWLLKTLPDWAYHRLV